MLVVSFLGGLLASISPCSLAMLPIFVGYVGGLRTRKPSQNAITNDVFCIGFMIVFADNWDYMRPDGEVFVSFAPMYFILLLGSLLMVMGLNILVRAWFQYAGNNQRNSPKHGQKKMILYPILIGCGLCISGNPLLYADFWRVNGVCFNVYEHFICSLNVFMFSWDKVNPYYSRCFHFELETV